MSYRQIYHANVLKGWGNDPNGIIEYNGQYHMFYQHYPHAPKWGIMHWGHFVSKDFIKWENCPIALYPDKHYEDTLGCWSGNAFMRNGEFYVMYTGATMETQTQNIAKSSDGIDFEKYQGNPVLTTKLAKELSPVHLRDPKVIEKDGYYYCFLGTLLHDKYGNIVLCRSKDLREWEYVGHLFDKQDNIDSRFFELDGVYECPDYFQIDGKDIIITSPQHLPQDGTSFENVNSCIYMVGKLNFETGHFEIESIHELDEGFDFYAAQALHTSDNRHILMAWKEMWHRDYPTEAEGWIGSYSLPRELTLENNVLRQRPVREIQAYRKNPLTISEFILDNEKKTFEGLQGNCIELQVSFEKEDDFEIRLLKGEHETKILFNRRNNTLSLDRSNSGIPIKGEEENTDIRTYKLPNNSIVNLDIFIDISSIEVFINDGQAVLTANVYPDPSDQGIEFFTSGLTKVLSVVKYDISTEK